MVRRTLTYPLLALGLTLALVALCLPVDYGALLADPAAEPASSDLKLAGGDCALFVTFRAADFTGDELANAVMQDLPKMLERELHVGEGNVERLTVAVLKQGPVQIVRTKKPYDAAKMNDAVPKPYRPYKYGKDKDVERPAEPAITELKAGGKKVYFWGERGRYSRGWCPLDKTTFALGNVDALEALAGGKGKPSSEMSDAMGLAATHSMVMGVDCKLLRAFIRHEREENERRYGGREKGFSKDKAAVRDDEKPKAKDDSDDGLFEEGMGVNFLVVKPLLVGRHGVLTFDVGKTYTLAGKVEYADKADVEDGETVLKAMLLFAREMAPVLPKNEREFAGFAPLGPALKKALKEAKVERKDTTLSVNVSLRPEAGMARKVREGVERQRKRWEEERKPRFMEKDKGTRIERPAFPSEKEKDVKELPPLPPSDKDK